MEGNGRRANAQQDSAPLNLRRRELGALAPRSFANRVRASEALVLHLGLHKKLDKHRGCVNTVSFNANGSILMSGSDDCCIMLWNWDLGALELEFHSGHTSNIFHALFVPNTCDRSIVTSAADGQVRRAQIRDDGEVNTELLTVHGGGVHKMAIVPESPHHMYSCGEDGLVKHFDLRTKSVTPLFFCKSVHDCKFHRPIIHLNAIAIDPRNPNLFAVAGSDEFVRLYDIRKHEWNSSSGQDIPVDYFCPKHLIGESDIGVTGLEFSDQSELLASYNDEQIYLFSRDQGLGSYPDMACERSLQASADIHSPNPNSSSSYSDNDDSDNDDGFVVYTGHLNNKTVKGVNFLGPRCDYVVSGSDCGRIFIWRKSDAKLLRAVKGDKDIVNCIESHPHTTIIASSGIESNIKIWIPNVADSAPPVDINEVSALDRIGYSSIYSNDCEVDDSDSDSYDGICCSDPDCCGACLENSDDTDDTDIDDTDIDDTDTNS